MSALKEIQRGRKVSQLGLQLSRFAIGKARIAA
jgi:hypothetical protein